ncbi:endoplasmic reticulum resident protein 27 [Microcaecilia unicolor]|uniref:protein disulfide-isomerase n=1 Tax=Microcaecilia unicolor TaxID=1415580 RepID=A0A6P7X5K6_9AMPH|nr:endoplasmic reticulum resident protein 27 [Microcaecilia unicolor]
MCTRSRVVKRMEGCAMCLLLLLLTAASQAGDKNESTSTTEYDRKPEELGDTAATQAFINSADVVVIGFFKDLEKPEVKDFYAVVKDLKDLPFGLTTSSQVLKYFSIKDNTISLFRQVDKRREDLELEKIKNLDAGKLSRFLQINELHLVTEYNPLTAVGLLNSTVKVHLLLFLDKTSEEHQATIQIFQEAANQLLGQVLFVLVDTSLKTSDRVRSFFHLKRSDLPAITIYNIENDKTDRMPPGEISTQHIKNFCNNFLLGKQTREDSNPVHPNTEDKALKTEL